jgi:hypothetical protein
MLHRQLAGEQPSREAAEDEDEVTTDINDQMNDGNISMILARITKLEESNHALATGYNALKLENEALTTSVASLALITVVPIIMNTATQILQWLNKRQPKSHGKEAYFPKHLDDKRLGWLANMLGCREGQFFYFSFKAKRIFNQRNELHHASTLLELDEMVVMCRKVMYDNRSHLLLMGDNSHSGKAVKEARMVIENYEAIKEMFPDNKGPFSSPSSDTTPEDGGNITDEDDYFCRDGGTSPIRQSTDPGTPIANLEILS